MIRYAITGGDDPIGNADRWASEAVDFVQLRAKDKDAGELASLARELLQRLNGKSKLMINGRVDVTVAVGAAGVHLTARPGELLPDQIRQVFALAKKPKPVISISCHTLEEIRRARDLGADLILFGPVFEKRVDQEAVVEGVGLDLLRRACAAAGPMKMLALGGVTWKNAQQCVDAGASGVAGIRLFG